MTRASACLRGVVLGSAVAGAMFIGCKADVTPGAERRWVRCVCSYVSDFDEPGAAPIDVCSEGHGTENVAATCVRNDGVGVPTSCRCEDISRGPCENRDRCRAAAAASD